MTSTVQSLSLKRLDVEVTVCVFIVRLTIPVLGASVPILKEVTWIEKVNKDLNEVDLFVYFYYVKNQGCLLKISGSVFIRFVNQAKLMQLLA